jgi:hypothetical protein
MATLVVSPDDLMMLRTMFDTELDTRDCRHMALVKILREAIFRFFDALRLARYNQEINRRMEAGHKMDKLPPFDSYKDEAIISLEDSILDIFDDFQNELFLSIDKMILRIEAEIGQVTLATRS